MHQSTLQQLVACICLLAFGLNTAVFARGFVRCTNVDGSTRMEWGCPKDDQGHCAAVCDGSTLGDDKNDHPESEPCEDTPASNTLIASGRTVTSKSFTLPPLLPVAVLPTFQAVVPVAPKPMCLRGPIIAASPPALLAIRTFVLLV